MFTGVYCITNELNNKKFVGYAENLMENLIYHMEKIWNKEYTYTLYCDVAAQGYHTFTYSVLEICTIPYMQKIAKYYADIWNTTNPLYGYNKWYSKKIQLPQNEYFLLVHKPNEYRIMPNWVCRTLDKLEKPNDIRNWFAEVVAAELKNFSYEK